MWRSQVLAAEEDYEGDGDDDDGGVSGGRYGREKMRLLSVEGPIVLVLLLF